MTAITHWQDNSPFVMRTTIRAQPMNTKLGGISANLQQITTKINGFVVKLPDNFVGNTEIESQSYHDTLLWINKEGNVDLVSRGELVANGSIEIEPVSNANRTFSVDGNNNNQFISCDYAMPDGATGDDAKVVISVGRSIRTFEGNSVVVPGTVIFLTANTDAELWLEGNETEGVTVDSPGTLKAYGKYSSIAIVSISETQWLLMGDIYPETLIP